MRALITGINGFVGGHLAEHLLRAGWDVAGISEYANPTPCDRWQEHVRIFSIDLMDAGATHTAIEANQAGRDLPSSGTGTRPDRYRRPSRHVDEQHAGTVTPAGSRACISTRSGRRDRLHVGRIWRGTS